ncbi:DUF6879 family protein [Amycolatopsis sp.]|uniref:DUF6879 family protein n=1 Tax=Amycolatopsis sp. TaxID=37632 RepID=UPI002D7F73F5|nr:DUF6879 family protein [Amycolatopsis sp.]HET6704100.1 hypothetical protein [Amycolatopsis sp.]
MSELFDDGLSEQMTLEEYSADFRKRRQDPRGSLESWKIERRQAFSDPEDPAWMAFSEGRWDESIRLMEENRPAYAKYYEEAATQGVTLYRVRIVDEPIQPYVQWELHYLRLSTSAGEKARVVKSEYVRKYEENEPLPEIITTGGDTVYKVVYSEEGRPIGARRIIDVEIAGRCLNFTKNLYATGEDMETYFEREIKHLRPPQVDLP